MQQEDGLPQCAATWEGRAGGTCALPSLEHGLGIAGCVIFAGWWPCMVPIRNPECSPCVRRLFPESEIGCRISW